MINEEMQKMQNFAGYKDYKNATKEEKILLINAQRFMMAVPYKSIWQVENENLISEKKKLQEEISKLNYEIGKWQEKLEYANKISKKYEDEVYDSKRKMDYAWNKIVFYLRF